MEHSELPIFKRSLRYRSGLDVRSDGVAATFRKKRPLRDLLLLWLGAVLIAGLVVLAVLGDAWSVAAAGLLLTVSGLAVLLGKRGRGVLAWRVLIPAYYGIWFSVIPLVEHTTGVRTFGQVQEVTKALLWAVAGVATFLLAGELGARWWPCNQEKQFGNGFWRALETRRVAFVLFVVGTAGVIASAFLGYFGLVGELAEKSVWAGAFQLIGAAAAVANVAAWVGWFRTRQRWWLVLAAGGSGVMLILALFAKSKGAFVVPILYAGASSFLVNKSLPRRALLLSVVIYFIFAYPFVNAWRSVGTTQYGNRLEQIEEGWQVLIGGQWLTAGAWQAANKSMGRGVLPLFATIVAETGTSIPFEDGGTYRTALQALVPRFLGGERPEQSIGHAVGRKYGVINLEDDVTNVAPSIMGEMYWNFGGLGVICGMMLLGLIAAWVDGWVVRRSGTWFLVWTAPAALLGQEGVVAQVGTQLMKEFIAATLIVAAVKLVSGVVMLRNGPSAAR